MNTPTKPMLAGEAPEVIKFPVMVSAKLDGIRCLVINGVAMSRSFKLIPNKHIQKILSTGCDGFDGELGVGDPGDPEFYLKTVSAVMRVEGEPDFTFYVFDRTDIDPETPYFERLRTLYKWVSGKDRIHPAFVQILDHVTINNDTELADYEAKQLALGMEGLILRDPNGKYKYGRSSSKEGILLKLKRFKDAEATVVSVQELLKNGNVAFKNELGRTARSSEKDQMIPQGTLGALKVKGLTAYEGVEFAIGTGYSAALKQELWNDRANLIGKIVKFKYFPLGSKDAPRFPVFIGFRDPRDM